MKIYIYADRGDSIIMAFGKKSSVHIESLITNIFENHICDILVVRKGNNDVIYANSAVRNRLNKAKLSSPEFGNNYFSLFPDLAKHCLEMIETSSELPMSVDIKCYDDRIFSVFCTEVTWVDDKPSIIIYLQDVDENRKNTLKLYNLAYIDTLTSMPNRRKFRDDFDEIESKVSAGELTGIVAILDIDNFKTINDTYGHNTGDLMLKRFAEYMHGNPFFNGHVYRLGGDEFALLYVDNVGEHENLLSHYIDIISNSIRSYSLPNIDISCTISMGISIFPKHGENISDLLRKADIALYKSKANGRNQFTFFEDQDDMAKTFKDVYLSIQPILTQNGKTFGYKLTDNGASSDPNSKETVNLTEFNRTTDMLGFEDFTNEAYYFINFTNQMLSFAPDPNVAEKFIVHIVLPEKLNKTHLEVYGHLKSLGYKIYMSELSDSNSSVELINIASFISFAPKSFSDIIQRKIIKENPGKKFIAYDIDNSAQFDLAQRIGFTLYQGQYFKEPVSITTKTKDIEPIRANYLRLLQLTCTDEYIDFNEISNIISEDLALSYKLLKLLNSVAIGLRNRISSISMGVAYLGEENLKKWISLLSIRGVAPDKPLELVRISLIRARLGELLAPSFKLKRDAKHTFLVGMLSLLHVALDRSMEDLFEEIPLADEIKFSLIGSTGPHSDLVEFFHNYENTNWEEVNKFAKINGIAGKTINEAYLASVKWCNDLINASE